MFRRASVSLTWQLPLGFFPPCLPTNGRSVPVGPEWCYEIKHDGYRFICRRDGKRRLALGLALGTAEGWGASAARSAATGVRPGALTAPDRGRWFPELPLLSEPIRPALASRLTSSLPVRPCSTLRVCAARALQPEQPSIGFDRRTCWQAIATASACASGGYTLRTGNPPSA